MAIALSIVVIWLHVVRMSHAGALWRDEAGAVQLAILPTARDILQNFQHEAFPILFPFAVRAYTTIVGAGDFDFRVLGMLVGMGIIGALWLNARLVGQGLPLISLVLLGFNPFFIQWGDSIRGYGLGIGLILLTFALLARVIEQPNWPRTAAALLAALASVHCLFYNSVLLFSICTAAITISLKRRRWRVASIVLGIGLVAALSMLPYVRPLTDAQQWNIVLKYPITLPWLWSQLSDTLGSPLPFMAWVWHVLLVLAVAGVTWLPWKNPTSELNEQPRDLLLICALAMLIAIGSYCVFLKILSYLTHPWHYLSLIALVAVTLDSVIQFLAKTTWIRTARLAFVIIITCTLVVPAWQKVQVRQTNIDLIIRELEKSSSAEDLILVDPWFCGVSFNRYYRTAANWMTLPNIADHQVHRYDLLKAKMGSCNPIDDILHNVVKTLQSGNRVWVVATIRLPRLGVAEPSLPPAPNSPWGWLEWPYQEVWSAQVGFFLLTHGLRSQFVRIPVDGPVSEYENLQLLVVQGWRDN
ncbi:hypothetical protein MYX65_03930 [Acidobacteria bacterium AH-259-L09]|nr:hypothetical protein [Acidobacteria bacterium AH-259-L09]